MCCALDCKPALKPGDWTPCIECMDAKELTEYQQVTGDMRREGDSRETRQSKVPSRSRTTCY